MFAFRPNTTIIHTDKGLENPKPRVYHEKVDARRRLARHEEEYTLGKDAPHYSVPAKKD